MIYQTIISAEDLNKNLNNPNWTIFDCRFDFDEPERAAREYLEGHIPGAIYADLDRELSSEVIPRKSGRHPLPDSQVLANRLSSWGVGDGVQVVVYDNKGGGLAGRLWWLLRWLGHEDVAVLDGDWNAWKNGNYPVETGDVDVKTKTFNAIEHPEYIADSNYVDEIREDPDFLLLDARSAERYWGINETIDSKAGHIPGAITAPYSENLDENGFFLDPAQLKERFQDLLEGIPAENVVVYCGSGVTAIHNIIAMVAAGYPMPKLYPGSWSEWIVDPDRPIAP
ncbi:MAG: sulfurtransferase [Chloroflexi bacterium]|nr:sulfurtransferase [Chloroflexota bacterium]